MDEFDNIPFCGTVTLGFGPLARWPGDSPDLPWHYDFAGYRGDLTRDQLLAAFEQAWAYWAELVDIRPRRVEARSQARVWGTFARIDGPSNVLAWSMLANDTNSPKEQRYDAGDTWVSVNPGVPSGGIDLVRVACHEIGHVLGLEHDAAGADALMAPMYSTRLPKPTARDAQRLVGLGYRKRTSPPPPAPPATPDPLPVTGLDLALPGGGRLTADYPTKTITYPNGWTGRAV